MTIRNKLQEEFSTKTAKYLKTNKICALDLSIRFGKTKTALMILEKLFINNPPKVLISYPDNKIKDSWTNDIIKWNYNNPNIVLTNTSSLIKYVDTKFDILILDEVHSLSEGQLESASLISNNSNYVLGLSGTLSKDTLTTLKNVLDMKVLISYTIEQAIKDGIVSDYIINIHQVDLDDKKKTKTSKGVKVTEKHAYTAMTKAIDWLRKSGRNVPQMLYFNRNRLLQNSLSKFNKTQELLKNTEGRFIVFTGLTKIADNIGIPSYHSKSKDKSGFDNFQNKITDRLALAESGKMGITYNDLKGVILMSFTGNEETTAQLLLRCIVLDYKNKIANVHIITTSEDAELKKLNKTLSMLDENKIKWII